MDKFSDLLNNLNISSDIKDSFLSQLKQLTIKKNEYFVRQGEPSKYVAYIIKGDFRYFKTDSKGNEHTLGFCFSYDFAGDYPSFLKQSQAEVNVQALSDCELIVMTHHQLTAFFEVNMDTQRFGRKLAEDIMADWQELLLSFHCDSPEQRYKRLLSMYPEIFQRVHLKHIASFIGVTPETISRIRAKLTI